MIDYNYEIALFFNKPEVRLFGFADLSAIPKESRYGFPRSISFGFPIEKEILIQIKSGPTPEYFSEYTRLNSLLLRTSNELAACIISLGFEALAMEGAARKYDTEALMTILPHKTSAVLSGLGWIGKNNLLTTEEYGSGIRLSTVLTDLPLRTGSPVQESKCGECRVCYQVCPAKAIADMNWKPGMKREELYDAFACQKMAKYLSDSIGANHTICGIYMYCELS